MSRGFWKREKRLSDFMEKIVASIWEAFRVGLNVEVKIMSYSSPELLFLTGTRKMRNYVNVYGRISPTEN